jgi:exopolyphosphatase/guanosine-5'-triphosphate,3'-diphosphate pyrophosphatase
MRLAAIDIGTNSVHMIVVQVRPDLSFEVIDREKEMVRLGAGGLDGRALTPTAATAALQALTKFKRLADAYGVDEIVAGATSATREAENGGDFLDAIARETGIRARVITGAEEARLVHLAAAYGIDLGRRAGVVVDIGGGSVEITLGSARHVALARSFKLGVIRLTERFVRSDPLSPRDERQLEKHVRHEIREHVARIRRRRFVRVVGTSGTILSLGALAASEESGTLPQDLRNVRVSARAIRRLRRRLLAMDQRERLQLAGLDPRRADLAVGGIVLVDTILQELGAEELTLCDLALREGLVLDYVRRNAAHIAQVDEVPDIRRRSVIELAQRCNYNAAHSHQVARLALSLFDQTRKHHGLGGREREWLEYGALLHDIGTHISYEAHHRHSYYLIKHGDLRGFEPDEIEAVALIARYHRRGAPKKSHAEVDRLPAPVRRALRPLAAFAAVAEGLDRSQAQVVSRVDVAVRSGGLAVAVQAKADAELEVWAANRHEDFLQKALGAPVSIALAQPPRGPARTSRLRKGKGSAAREAARRRAAGSRAATRRRPRAAAGGRG